MRMDFSLQGNIVPKTGQRYNNKKHWNETNTELGARKKVGKYILNTIYSRVRMIKLNMKKLEIMYLFPRNVSFLIKNI